MSRIVSGRLVPIKDIIVGNRARSDIDFDIVGKTDISGDRAFIRVIDLFFSSDQPS